jgi:hypothetical protein
MVRAPFPGQEEAGEGIALIAVMGGGGQRKP